MKSVLYVVGEKTLTKTKSSFATGVSNNSSCELAQNYIICFLLQYRGSQVEVTNKLVFPRCQIAVHQECYGARNVDITSWVCRVCETPDVPRECCLCPVRGMKFFVVITVKF